MQLAGVTTLNGQQDCTRELSSIYERRMKKMVNGLQKMDWRANEISRENLEGALKQINATNL